MQSLLAWVQRTQPLIITDSKQLVLFSLFSQSNGGKRVHSGRGGRKSREDDIQGKDGLKMDENCPPHFLLLTSC